MKAEWKSSWLSSRSLFPVLCIALGVIIFPVGLVHLFSPTKSLERLPATLFTFCGLWFIFVSSALLYFPANRVELSEDGSFTFISPRRQLIVNPGELITVHKIWFDPNRLLPFWVKGQRGGILLSSRVQNLAVLRELLIQYSPDATVCRLTSIFSAANASDPGVNWDIPTIEDHSKGSDSKPPPH